MAWDKPEITLEQDTSNGRWKAEIDFNGRTDAGYGESIADSLRKLADMFEFEDEDELEQWGGDPDDWVDCGGTCGRQVYVHDVLDPENPRCRECMAQESPPA